MMEFFSSRARALERPARREARSAAAKARAHARVAFSLAPHAGVCRPVSTARAPAHSATRAARRARPRARERRERVFAASNRTRASARARARERRGAKDAAGRGGHVGDDDDASSGDARREARRARARNGRRWSDARTRARRESWRARMGTRAPRAIAQRDDAEAAAEGGANADADADASDRNWEDAIELAREESDASGGTSSGRAAEDGSNKMAMKWTGVDVGGALATFTKRKKKEEKFVENQGHGRGQGDERMGR